MSAVRGNESSAVELSDGPASLRKPQHFCCLYYVFFPRIYLNEIGVSRRPLMQSEAWQTEQRSSAGADNKETLAYAFSQ